jgi:hypothetical protein
MLRMPEVRDDAPDSTALPVGAVPSTLFRMRDGGVPEANTTVDRGTPAPAFKSLRSRRFVAAARVARDLTPGP